MHEKAVHVYMRVYTRQLALYDVNLVKLIYGVLSGFAGAKEVLAVGGRAHWRVCEIADESNFYGQSMSLDL